MLSCKKCGAQMSGIDLVCKNCGTPWGKKHKSRMGLYLSVFVIILTGAISYIYYTPGVKEKLLAIYNDTLVSNQNEEKNNNLINTDEQPQKNNIENETTTPPENEQLPPTPPENEVTPPVVETPPEPTPPVFTWISASSALKTYEPRLTTDGKLETAWLEGVKGNGIDEWIMYSAEADQTVSSITIYNGYLKNDKVYINNGRIKKLSLEFSDGEIITKDIEKAQYSKAKEGYTITFERPKITSSIKITILDAYQGAYYTDTGISEITFK